MLSFLEIILIGVGLAMDAFAVSICKGLVIREKSYKKALIVGLYFGLFQGLMPLLGYYLGIFFKDVVMSIDHWIAFALLSVIGINMIRECFSNEEEISNDSVKFKDMIFLAIATSIDALAIGITFAFLSVNIYLASFIILGITMLLSFVGVILGNKFGNKLGKKAELFGGIILVIIGIKILLEHLNLF